MKTFSIIAAATALAFAGTAFAQGEATYDYPQPVTSVKSRAEVQAEAVQARANGEIVSGEASATQTPFVASKTRAEVQAETAAARASGELEALHSEGGVPSAHAVAPAAAPVRVSVRK